MSIVKIEKINIIFPPELKERVLDLLQETGIAQVDNFDEEILKEYNTLKNSARNAKLIDCEYLAAEAQFAINFLDKFKDVKKQSLLKKLRDGGLLKIGKEKYDETIKNFDYKKAIEECKSLEEKINLSQNEIDKFAEEKARYDGWKKLQIDFGSGLETDYAKTTTGMIKTQDYNKLLEILAKGDENFVLEQIEIGGAETKIVFVYLKEKEEYFKKILNQADFKEVKFFELNSTVGQKIQNLDQNIIAHSAEKERLVLTARELVKKQNNLKIIFDYFSARLNYEKVSENLLNMNFVSVLQAWVPEKQFENLKENLQKISEQIYIFKVELKENDNVPVVLKNGNFIESFEGITKTYGLPKAGDMDPTWWLSLSFLIFFGFCLSDAGYGLFLAAASLFAIKILKIPKEKQGMLRLMIYCGIFTIIIGALFGSWFGVNLDTLPAGFLGDTLKKIRLIDPMKDPLTVMYAAFALGFLHILWGLIARFYQRLRDKKYLEAMLDTGLWLYFLPSLAYWAITYSRTGKMLVIIGAVLLILTQGRSSKNIFAKFFGGALGLYNTVAFFSDILSYSRLLALGLATAVISLIINQIAILMGGMVPYVGWIIMILIILLGHAFNFCINVLGSYIHSSRLEFVEFFGKFFEGGGRAFEPFRKNFKYISVKYSN